MMTALVTAFLQAKMRDAKTSVALYSVSSDVGGLTIAQQVGIRSDKAIADMLATAREPLMRDPQLVASVLQGAMAGVSRRLLESEAPEEHFAAFRDELILLVDGYIQTCSVCPRGEERRTSGDSAVGQHYF
jgi:hypothetical protein